MMDVFKSMNHHGQNILNSTTDTSDTFDTQTVLFDQCD